MTLLDRTLVLCPLSVTYSWEQEMQQWGGTEPTVVVNSTAKKLAALEQPGPWVMNTDGLAKRERTTPGEPWVSLDGKRHRKAPNREQWHYPILAKLLEMAAEGLIECVVLDESTSIKNHTSIRGRAAFTLAKAVPRRIALSGLPNPQDPLDLWSQCRFVEPEEYPLGFPSYYAMKGRYCVMGGYEGREIVAYRHLEEAYEKFGAIAHRRTKDKCLSLPPVTYVPIDVELTPREKKLYKQMKDEALVQLEAATASGIKNYIKLEGSERNEIEGVNPLAVMVRLRQLAGGMGVAYDGCAKLKVLMEMLETIPKPVVVWGSFKGEVDAIAAACRKAKYRTGVVDGRTSPAKRKEILKAFAAGDVDVFVGHPQAAGIGVQLQRASTMFWYSNGLSFEHRQQGVDRIHRGGQEADRVTVYDLLAKGTLDRSILSALKRKSSVAKAVLDSPRDFLEGRL